MSKAFANYHDKNMSKFVLFSNFYIPSKSVCCKSVEIHNKILLEH